MTSPPQDNLTQHLRQVTSVGHLFRRGKTTFSIATQRALPMSCWWYGRIRLNCPLTPLTIGGRTIPCRCTSLQGLMSLLITARTLCSAATNSWKICPAFIICGWALVMRARLPGLCDHAIYEWHHGLPPVQSHVGLNSGSNGFTAVPLPIWTVPWSYGTSRLKPGKLNWILFNVWNCQHSSIQIAAWLLRQVILRGPITSGGNCA